MRVLILGGIEAGLDPGPASDEGRGSQCQHVCHCTYSGGSKSSSMEDTAIAGAHIPAQTWGAGSKVRLVVWHQPLQLQSSL